MGCFVLQEWPLQLSRKSRVIKPTMEVWETFIYKCTYIYIYVGVFYILCIQDTQWCVALRPYHIF